MSGIGKQRGRRVPASLRIELVPRWSATLEDHVIALAWSPDGRWLAAAAITGPIGLFDGASGQLLVQFPGHTMGTTALAWHPSQPLLASTGQDGKVRLWDATSGLERMAVPAGAAWGERVAWSPAGDYLANAAGRVIRLWTSDGQIVREWADHSSTVADIQWEPGGQKLAAATYGGVTLWSPERTTPVRRYEWKGSTLVLAWSPDGSVIATGDQDATVHFWYVASGKDLQMWGYETKVLELSWHPGGRYLATGGGSIPCVWDCAGPRGPEGSRPVQLRAHAAPVRALSYQHAGSLLATGGSEGGVALWQPDKTDTLLSGASGATGVSQLRWSPDDQYLAVGRESGMVELLALDVATGR